jgi:hypothetical protein
MITVVVSVEGTQVVPVMVAYSVSVQQAEASMEQAIGMEHQMGQNVKRRTLYPTNRTSNAQEN